MLVTLRPASREGVLRTLREIESAALNANSHSGNSRIDRLQPSGFLLGVGDELGSDAAAASIIGNTGSSLVAGDSQRTNVALGRPPCRSTAVNPTPATAQPPTSAPT